MIFAVLGVFFGGIFGLFKAIKMIVYLHVVNNTIGNTKKYKMTKENTIRSVLILKLRKIGSLFRGLFNLSITERMISYVCEDAQIIKQALGGYKPMKHTNLKTVRNQNSKTRCIKEGVFTMKKVITVLVSIVIIFSVFISSFAYDTSVNTYQVTFESNSPDSNDKHIESITLEGDTACIIFPDGPTRSGYIFKEWNTSPSGNGINFDPGDTLNVLVDDTVCHGITFYAIWETDENSPVAMMYLCATANSLTGHVWLYFDNISDKNINVGYVELEPGEQTSVGSLKNTRTDGGGTYYNGEAYMAKSIDTTGAHTTYLSIPLTSEQLKTVSDQIQKRNSYNLIVWNCGNFATAVWNSVSPHKIVHVVFPIFTVFQMLIHGAKKGLTMTRPPISDCYKQVDGGIKKASASSFNYSCV